MPPSPSLRCSPRRELRTESQHKRGQSYESGVSVKVKDDDLALFNDMQVKERENFLLQSNDDLEDTLAKLKCFSDYRLDVSIPARGENSDLLNADTEKNDYDWLLTPPETPLFPYLDEDDRPVDVHSTRGRHRSQPISIPSSSMAERSQRSSRNSASPHNRSPSPRCSGSASSRGRASSAPHSSPPGLRTPTPVRRSSTPPNRPSTPRSSTPTHRKMSSGSSMQSSSSGRRGASPSKGSRGSSPSPKLQDWHADLLGFSSDAPPNLRTSLSDRPASYTRGLSPASTNGRERHSKYNRQSMSPTASRSASSSHSYDLDRFSPHSKGSIISSGDEDLDSVRSVSTGISPSPTARRNGAFVKSKAMGYAKKPSLTPSAFSAPKRSFDSSLKQMDQRKAPQNMFRPLLSSVPSSTFHISKTNTIHRPTFSRNSSLTTSSNASSEMGACVVPYNEGIEYEHTDVAVEWRNMPHTLQEESSVSNSVDGIKEDISCESRSDGDKKDIILNEFETPTSGLGNSNVPNAATDLLYVARNDHSNVNPCLRMTICSICNKVFSTAEAVDEKDTCNDCVEREKLHDIELRKTSCTQEHHTSLEEGKSSGLEHPLSLQKHKMFGTGLGQKHSYLEDDTVSHETNTRFAGESHKNMDVPGCSAESSYADLKIQHKAYVERGSGDSGENASTLDVITEERSISNQQLDVQQMGNAKILAESSSLELDAKEKDYGYVIFENKMVPATSESSCMPIRSESSSACSSTNVDRPERTGISVLLDRASSNKGPLIHGRTLTPSLQCAESTSLRDSMHTMKLSSSWNSSTGSTSLDLGSSRPKEQHTKQKLGIKKTGYVYAGNDSLVNSESSLSLERSGNSMDDLVHTHRNKVEDDVSAAPLNFIEHELTDYSMASNSEQSISLEHTACQTLHFSVSMADNYVNKNHSENIASGTPKLLESSTKLLTQHQCSVAYQNAEVDCGNGTGLCILPDKSFIGPGNDSGSSENSGPTLSDTRLDENSVSASDHSLKEAAKSNSNRMYCSSQPVMSTKLVLNEKNSQNFKYPQTGCKSVPVPLKLSESHSLPVNSVKDVSTAVLETSNGNTTSDIHEGLKATAKSSEDTVKGKDDRATQEKSTDKVTCKSAGTEEEQTTLEPVHSVSETNIPGPMDQTLTHRKHAQDSQRDNVKNSKTDMRFPPSEPWDHAKIHKIPGSIGKVEGTKPPKLESKCNCSIM